MQIRRTFIQILDAVVHPHAQLTSTYNVWAIKASVSFKMN